jgi:hypothetical protein
MKLWRANSRRRSNELWRAKGACGLVGYSASFAMKRSGVRISPGPRAKQLLITNYELRIKIRNEGIKILFPQTDYCTLTIYYLNN